jgi:hypothetical protein
MITTTYRLATRGTSQDADGFGRERFKERMRERMVNQQN